MRYGMLRIEQLVTIWLCISLVQPVNCSTVIGQNNGTFAPSSTPTLSPSISVTTNATTPIPSQNVTKTPTTASPTSSPTDAPIRTPSASPTLLPTRSPLGVNETHSPTESPTWFPTAAPSRSPTSTPTSFPTRSPLAANQTHFPSTSPTASPTVFPTRSPLGLNETHAPSGAPTASPTRSPLAFNTTHSPTPAPTVFPTQSPLPGNLTHAPTTLAPTTSPSLSPSTAAPTGAPTLPPSSAPTESPTIFYGFVYSEWSPCHVSCDDVSSSALVQGTKSRNATCHRGEGEATPDGSTGDPLGAPQPAALCGDPALSATCHGTCAGRSVSAQIADSPVLAAVVVATCGAVLSVGAYRYRGLMRRPVLEPAKLEGGVPYTGALVALDGGAKPPPPPPPRASGASTGLASAVHVPTRLARAEARAAAGAHSKLFPCAPEGSKLPGPRQGQGALTLEEGQEQPTINAALKEEIHVAQMIRSQWRPEAPLPPPIGAQGTVQPVKPKANDEDVRRVLDEVHDMQKPPPAGTVVEPDENSFGPVRNDNQQRPQKTVPVKPTKPIHIAKPAMAHAVAQAEEVDRVMSMEGREVGRRSSFDFGFEEAMQEALERTSTDKSSREKLLNKTYTDALGPYFKEKRLVELGATLPRAVENKPRATKSAVVVVGHGSGAKQAATLPRRGSKGKSLRAKMLRSLTKSTSRVPSHFEVQDRENEKVRRKSLRESSNPLLANSKPDRNQHCNGVLGGMGGDGEMELIPELDPVYRANRIPRGKAQLRAMDEADFPVPEFVGGDSDEEGLLDRKSSSLSTASSFMSSISVVIAKANAKAFSNRAKPTNEEIQVAQPKKMSRKPAESVMKKPELLPKSRSHHVSGDIAISVGAPSKPPKPSRLSSSALLKHSSSSSSKSTKKKPAKPVKPLHLSKGPDLC